MHIVEIIIIIIVAIGLFVAVLESNLTNKEKATSFVMPNLLPWFLLNDSVRTEDSKKTDENESEESQDENNDASGN